MTLAPIIFIIAALLSFATGTAWGTFGILYSDRNLHLFCSSSKLYNYMSVATLAGSVFGDHCSPISDTTILSSTGSQCNHLKHVGTQIPYAVIVAVCCAIGYVVAGVTNSLGQGVSTVISFSSSYCTPDYRSSGCLKVWNIHLSRREIINAVKE